jgi:ABC-2 type transport system ATP-binding protein
MERLREHTTIFYSTHILDDVQRVSDHVVILHQGRKVADAKTSQLLDGGCTYQLDLRGDTVRAKVTLESLPWVSEIALSATDNGDRMTVTVTDQGAGDALLLRTILGDDDVTVTSFGRKHHNLEDVFLHLVEGDET